MKDSRKKDVARATQPDPLDVIYGKPPGPVIMTEEDELTVERKPSASLIVNLVLALLGLTALVYAVGWLALNYF